METQSRRARRTQSVRAARKTAGNHCGHFPPSRPSLCLRHRRIRGAHRDQPRTRQHCRQTVAPWPISATSGRRVRKPDRIDVRGCGTGRRQSAGTRPDDWSRVWSPLRVAAFPDVIVMAHSVKVFVVGSVDGGGARGQARSVGRVMRERFTGGGFSVWPGSVRARRVEPVPAPDGVASDASTARPSVRTR
jgi:hypothetical protein